MQNGRNKQIKHKDSEKTILSFNNGEGPNDRVNLGRDNGIEQSKDMKQDINVLRYYADIVAGIKDKRKAKSGIDTNPSAPEFDE